MSKSGITFLITYTTHYEGLGERYSAELKRVSLWNKLGQTQPGNSDRPRDAEHPNGSTHDSMCKGLGTERANDDLYASLLSSDERGTGIWYFTAER